MGFVVAKDVDLVSKSPHSTVRFSDRAGRDLTTTSRQTLGSTQHPIQWVLGNSPRG